MLDERDSEKAEAKKAEKAAGAKRPAPKGKAKGKAKAKPHADLHPSTPAKGLDPAKAKGKAADETPPPAKQPKRPTLSFEQSRGPPHFLCRSGLGGLGSTCRFKFGKGEEYPSEAAARAAAERWVKAELKRRGLE
jgi:hypothetical protein